MSGAAGKAASKVAQTASRAAGKANEIGGKPIDNPLSKATKKDPELYILGGIMASAFGMAGYYFGRKPTSSVSEAAVSMADSSMPWQNEDEGGRSYKYKYHPGGDRSKPAKEAPSALNSTYIPALTLPKKLHDQYNKWGKDDWY